MLKDMKLGKKIILSFIAVTILAIAAALVAELFLIRNNKTAQYSLNYYGFAQGDIGKLLGEFQGQRAIARDIIFLSDDNEIKAAQQDLEASSKTVDALLANVEKYLVTDEEKSLLAQVHSDLIAYNGLLDRVVDLGLQNKNVEALTLFRGEGLPITNRITGKISQIMESKMASGNAAMKEMVSAGIFATTATVVIAAVAVLLSLIIAISIARSISAPVGMMAGAVKKVSEGDLSVHVGYRSGNEIGLMAASMNSLIDTMKKIVEDVDYLLGKMAVGNFDIRTRTEVSYVGDFGNLLTSIRKINSGLSKTMIQINEVSTQVSGGSEQVSSGAQALSQGATEQASSVEELAATIADISSRVTSNAESAAEASSKANAVGGEATESNRRMQDMLSAMNDISGSSGQISKIIKTIEDIAFQTNILALNAAVEAARAGSAGKGFAVVADEVRNLASKSAEASKNTAELIAGSLTAVEHGTAIAGETAKSLEVVVQGIKEVAGTVDKISASSNDQAQSIMQITTGVDQISSVVQTNSATAEESAAASEELSGQALMLKNLVSRFTLREDAGGRLETFAALPDDSYYQQDPPQSSKY